jgi:hypothetical protein
MKVIIKRQMRLEVMMKKVVVTILILKIKASLMILKVKSIALILKMIAKSLKSWLSIKIKMNLKAFQIFVCEKILIEKENILLQLLSENTSKEFNKNVKLLCSEFFVRYSFIGQ